MKGAKAIVFVVISLFTTVYAQVPSVEWHYDLDDMSFGQSAMADIDNDSWPEIVFGTYRNDGMVYALNAEDGSVLWTYNTGGCNDVAPVIYDVDQDGQLEVIVPSSCVAKTFCLNGLTGSLEWQAPTRGSDSPPTIADIDGDAKPEILHGEFGGYVICLNGEDGSQAWEIAVDLNSWIQTAPAITDLDNDDNLDFVVANWNFGTDHKIFAYRAYDQQLLWTCDLPEDVMYHGAAIADLDRDGLPELTIGSYDGYVYCLNGEDGSLYWKYAFPTLSYYVGGPTSIGDLDNDGMYEVVFFDVGRAGLLSHDGNLQWAYDFGGYHTSFRGGALSDINGDDTLDIIFGTGDGRMIALSGGSGSLIWSLDLEILYGNDFEIDHGPVVGDFDKDGVLEAFVVGGHAEYPNIQNNYGRGYAISCGQGSGPGWPMFRNDIRRNAAILIDSAQSNPDILTVPVSLSIQPNPSIGIPGIFLESDYSGTVSAEVYDHTGKLVWNNQLFKSTVSLPIDLAGMPARPGCYFLRISTQDFNASSHFIILH